MVFIEGIMYLDSDFVSSKLFSCCIIQPFSCTASIFVNICIKKRKGEIEPIVSNKLILVLSYSHHLLYDFKDSSMHQPIGYTVFFYVLVLIAPIIPSSAFAHYKDFFNSTILVFEFFHKINATSFIVAV